MNVPLLLPLRRRVANDLATCHANLYPWQSNRTDLPTLYGDIDPGPGAGPATFRTQSENCGHTSKLSSGSFRLQSKHRLS